MLVVEKYKKTEAGIIPRDWKIKKIKEVLDFSTDTISTELFDDKYYVSTENLLPNKKGVKPYDGVLNCRCVREYRKEDILISNIRPYLKKIWFAENNGGCSADVIVFRNKDNKRYYSKFIFFQLSDDKFFEYTINTATGTKMPRGDKKLIAEYFLKAPQNIQEQQAIADVLRDTDNLISSLQRLIDKKKAVKQGAMEELLTGKRRLPGFNGGWVEKKLEAVLANITTGKLDANAMKENGKYRFYTCAKEFYKIDKYAFDTEAILISGNGANVGYIHYYKGKFNAYQRTYVLYDFYENINFIRYYLKLNLKKRIANEKSESNTPFIKMDTLLDMSLVIPLSKEEQEAIARVLSDMDSEINELEKKLSKYEKIKQGMMQQLLTGRIRLLD